MPYELFTKLEVYQACRRLRKEISELVKARMPEQEKYRLADQLIRASRSVSACIAEGHGRYYYKENIKFCRMARGSLSETLDHLITAYDEQYIDQDTLERNKNKIDTCTRLLNGYMRHLIQNESKKF